MDQINRFEKLDEIDGLVDTINMRGISRMRDWSKARD